MDVPEAEVLENAHFTIATDPFHCGALLEEQNFKSSRAFPRSSAKILDGLLPNYQVPVQIDEVKYS